MREWAMNQMRPEHTDFNVLLNKVELQISGRDIPTSQMPQEQAAEWRKRYASQIAASISSRRLAQSPRGFFVGGSSLYYDPRSLEYKMAMDANLKVSNNQSPPKMCAERRLLRQIHLGPIIAGWLSEKGKLISGNRAEQSREIVGLVITSDQADPTQEGEQADNSYKEKKLVLHPCDQCLQLLSKDDLIKPWTRMLLINDKDIDHLIIEDLSVEELLVQHRLTKVHPDDYLTYLTELAPDFSLPENVVEKG